MADVFISYKREERQAVEGLANELRRLDLNVWFDASLSAGEAFSDEIDREARAAKAILVCWSPGARASDWVKAEALIGFTNKNLAACYAAGPDGFDPPAPFNSVHAEDLRAWLVAPSNAHAGWKSILRRIGRLCNREDIESFGALDVQAPTSMLRSWLVQHETSPLFPIVNELLCVRDVEDSARMRLEQEERERRARQESERRERDETERRAQEEEERRRRAEREARAQGEREAEVAAGPSGARWRAPVATIAATALVALVIVLFWQPWRSISGPVASAPTDETMEAHTGIGSSVEMRSPVAQGLTPRLMGITVGTHIDGVLSRFGQAGATEIRGQYTIRGWDLNDGNRLSVTASAGLVQFIELDWGRGNAAINAQFPQMQFGRTSVQEIRSRLRSNGMVFERWGGVASPQEADGVAYLNTYDISGVFVTFVSCIRIDDYRQWLTIHDENIAKLCAIILTSHEYADENFGPITSEYQRAEWR